MGFPLKAAQAEGLERAAINDEHAYDVGNGHQRLRISIYTSSSHGVPGPQHTRSIYQSKQTMSFVVD
ncbi:unnamed protein product, partial [Mycena citricolor]